MSMYMKMKNRMIEKHPDAVDKYAYYVNSIDNITKKERVVGYLYFIKLLLGNNKKRRIRKSEFDDTKRPETQAIINKLLKYDVVSFDVFDTLILRNVEKPIDVFRIVGAKNNISGYEKIRRKAEQQCYKEYGNKTTIDNIYDRISLVNGLNPNSMISEEFNTEMNIIEPNPYMKKIYDAMIENGKTVIIISDMYWPEKYMKRLLNKCGYDNWNKMYVSCDYGASKRSGELYKIVSKGIGNKSKWIHIGDNKQSDIRMAKSKGIDCLYYKNVNDIGREYRHGKYTERSVGESVANAIINNEIHNGITELNSYQQFGYIYGGMLVAGYCNWLNEKAKEKNVDKLLFLARDSYIIHKCYNDFYKEYDCDYVFASRKAVLYLVMDRYPELYIERVIKEHAEEANKSVEAILKQSHMDCLINHLSEVGVNKDDCFNVNNFKYIVQLIYQYKSDILKELEQMQNAAKVYWTSVIGDSKTIALVDVGWRGTISFCLKYFLNDICDIDVDIISFFFASYRDAWNQQEYDEGKMLSYCCSSDFNTSYDSVLKHDLIRTMLVEIMFSSVDDSLIEYNLKRDVECELIYEPSSKDNEPIIKDMHSGIWQYVKTIKHCQDTLGVPLNISGENALLPIYKLKRSRKYILNLFSNYKYSLLAGSFGSDISMKENFKRRGL
ncbi:MAG: HAD-IA family hydrolase [Lachnospiraceae bacterium]|nr:HAD-IA family hydrolase [Lachnospiraceae bacterium]